MVGLLDIVPQSIQVPIDAEKKLEVHGLSARSIAMLLSRFPDLLKVLSGGGMTAADLRKIAPDALAAIIAASNGHPGNPKAEAAADTLPLEVQLDIMEAVGKLTFPSGVGPFVQRLTAISNAASVQVTRVLDTKSPPQPKPSDPPPMPVSGI